MKCPIFENQDGTPKIVDLKKISAATNSLVHSTRFCSIIDKEVDIDLSYNKVVLSWILIGYTEWSIMFLFQI